MPFQPPQLGVCVTTVGALSKHRKIVPVPWLPWRFPVRLLPAFTTLPKPTFITLIPVIFFTYISWEFWFPIVVLILKVF